MRLPNLELVEPMENQEMHWDAASRPLRFLASLLRICRRLRLNNARLRDHFHCPPNVSPYDMRMPPPLPPAVMIQAGLYPVLVENPIQLQYPTFPEYPPFRQESSRMRDPSQLEREGLLDPYYRNADVPVQNNFDLENNEDELIEQLGGENDNMRVPIDFMLNKFLHLNGEDCDEVDR